jgi:hypothetical protein
MIVNKCNQRRDILLLSTMLMTIAYNSVGQVGHNKTMHFRSPFGSFSIQTPIGWKQIELQPVSSFDGLIAIGGKDTLNFSLGFWSSLLHDGQLLSTTSNDGKYVPAKKYERKIDGYDAFTVIPDERTTNEARIYIDSLYSFYSMGLVVKFDFYGNNLSKTHQKLFYQVIRTIKFEKP